MPTSHDSGFDVTLPYVATGTEAATANVLYVTATTLIPRLILTTATSGNTCTAKFYGRVNDVTKSSATTFLSGTPLQIGTNLTALAQASAGTICNAIAIGGNTTTSTLMDVLLVPTWTV